VLLQTVYTLHVENRKRPDAADNFLVCQASTIRSQLLDFFAKVRSKTSSLPGSTGARISSRGNLPGLLFVDARRRLSCPSACRKNEVICCGEKFSLIFRHLG